MALDNKIKELIELLEKQKKELSRQEHEIEFLKEELKKASAENVELQRKYDNLKIARGTISISGGDVSEAKRRLTDIMNRIDVCIEKLSR